MNVELKFKRLRYVAYASCGCLQGFVITGERGASPKEAAELVSMWVKDGCTIYTHVNEAADVALGWNCEQHTKD